MLITTQNMTGSTLFASLKVLCNPLPRWVHDKYCTPLLSLLFLMCGALTFQRLDLSIDFGHDKEYYEELVKEQSFEPLNLEVRKINDEMNLWVYQLLVLYDVIYGVCRCMVGIHIVFS